MTCTKFAATLDDYVDGRMEAAAAAKLGGHVATCEACRGLLAGARQLRESLKDYGESAMPHADAAFFDRALWNAVREGTRRQRKRWVMTGAGGAVAAAIVLWMLGGLLLTSPEVPQPAVPAVAMTLEEPRTVHLVFSSATALADATMTVILPQGVEVQGFAGLREITWMTSLNAGKNVLPLTLIATSPHGGELLATLRHGAEDKTFRVRVSVIQGA